MTFEDFFCNLACMLHTVVCDIGYA